QASYAAANGFLDGLAELRQHDGRPALVVDWGPWAGAGFAATRERTARLVQIGLDPMSPDLALTALGMLVDAAVGRATVMRFDSDRWARALPADRTRPYFSTALASPRQPTL